MKDKSSLPRLHLDFVDSLRALAILGVMLVHTEQWCPVSHPLLKLVCANGARGVQLFFVASAFTLFLSMTRRRKREAAPLANFFVRRFFRIAPLFYAAIVYFLWQVGRGPQYWAPSGIDGAKILLTATFTHGWHPETITSVVPGGWSVADEMTFYLCLPVLAWLIRSRAHAFGFVVVAVCLRLLAQTYLLPLLVQPYPAELQYLNSTFDALWFFSQLSVFAVGILLYFVFIEEKDKPSVPLGYAYLAVFGLIALAGLSWSTHLTVISPILAYGVAFIFLALGLFHTRCPLVVNPVFAYIGKISFSLYICHYAVLFFFWGRLPGGIAPGSRLAPLLSFLFVVGVSSALASVTYLLIERPGIWLGQQVTGAIERRCARGKV